MRHSLSLSVLLIAFLLVAGCDDDNPVERDRRGDVYAQNFRFYLEDTSRPEGGFIASAKYDGFDIPLSAVQDGAVLLYYRAYEAWNAMPVTSALEATNDPPRVDFTVTFGYSYERDFLEVYLDASSSDDVVWEDIEQTRGIFTADGIGDADGIRMKVVVIESFQAARKKGVDFSDYREVAEAYDLER